jgi:hypothetical protein
MIDNSEAMHNAEEDFDSLITYLSTPYFKKYCIEKDISYIDLKLSDCDLRDLVGLPTIK